ncbi:NADPH-dependent methylglyoxal reductase GRE2 protein [Ceratobasidium sp. AG-Ba]|nr:NADPH-dependent methylglyoxal reductase GRE2 protein [Ceratobasidium sp. AG-Ba]
MSPHILVTGGNGFIAVHVISLLLQHGYTITTTVRSQSKTAHLRKIFSTAVVDNQLRFVIVEDITVAGAFDEVVKNNKFNAVLHISSPVIFNVTDIENDILKPAIKGTTGLLQSIKNRGPTVKRVVITSSFAAIVDLSKGDRPGYAYSEKDWDPITEEEAKQNAGLGYTASKKLAEKAAWDFIENEKPGFDLVTLCPPMVYGPALQEVPSLDRLNHTSEGFYAIFSGQDKELQQTLIKIWADVRDVAKAHLAAIEIPQAGNNRFLISEGQFNVGRLSDFIWKTYPERAQAKGIPKSKPEHYLPGGTYYPDNSKSKQILGLEYNSFENALKDTLDQFIALEKELGVE